MADSFSLRPITQKLHGKFKFLRWLIVLLLVSAAISVFFGPISGHGAGPGPQSSSMLNSSTIALAMFQFANDHQGKYPKGRSSTEVFQQLLDQNYVTSPEIFYAKIPGKKKATSNNLKAENVAYDLTGPADLNSPETLPLVFLTGYRIEYKAGGSAIPLFAHSSGYLDGIAVCYVGHNAIFRPPSSTMSYGTIEHFIPSDFDPKGQHFQQLTPDGPLPPAPSGG